MHILLQEARKLADPKFSAAADFSAEVNIVDLFCAAERWCN